MGINRRPARANRGRLPALCGPSAPLCTQVLDERLPLYGRGCGQFRAGAKRFRKRPLTFLRVGIVATVLPLTFLLGTALNARAGEGAFDEYQVKAAFLYNFAKFVEWPPGTFANATDPIGICIVGQNPFGSMLEAMVQGKKLGERAFVVRRLADMRNSANCQILFIGAAEWKRTHGVPEAPHDQGILTVGETDDFTALGGIIGFRLDGTRIRIQIAIDSADRAKLHISSKLLSLAEIVKKQP
jgi:hypothetical protein